MTAADAAAGAGEDVLRSADDVALEAEIADIKSRVDAIGPVNLMAIDEFRALEERHAHLSAQQKDLVDAMASLRETISTTPPLRNRFTRRSRESWREPPIPR